MRTQRRPPQTVRLRQLAVIEGTPQTAELLLDGAIFEPARTAETTGRLTQARDRGTWYLPGLHDLTGDDEIVDDHGDTWQVTGGATPWLDRTEAPVRRATPYATRVSIGTGGTAPQWDATQRRTTTGPGTVVYAGPARITPMGETAFTDTSVEVAGDDVDVRRYAIEIDPLTEGAGLVLIGHRVTVHALPEAVVGDDPALWGRRLTVTGVALGSGQLVRTLTASLED